MLRCEVIVDVNQSPGTVWAGAFQKDCFFILPRAERFYEPGSDVSDLTWPQLSGRAFLGGVGTGRQSRLWRKQAHVTGRRAIGTIYVVDTVGICKKTTSGLRS